MFNPQTVIEAYRGLVGIRNEANPKLPTLTGTFLATSDVGLYLQGIHPLCTLENIYYASPDFSAFNWRQWADTEDYPALTAVQYNDVLYKSNVDVDSGGSAPDNNSSWSVYQPFIDWLKDEYDGTAAKFVSSVIQVKKYERMAKALLDYQPLFAGYGTIADRIVKSGRFVGLVIRMQPADGLLLEIKKIALQLDTAQEEVNIYLYHSSVKAPMIFPIEVAAANTFAWDEVENAIISAMNNNPAGFSILGYYEDDLDGQAVNYDRDFMAAPCTGCSRINTDYYNAWSKYATIYAIEVPASALDPSNDLFDINKIQRQYNTNWGLNLMISTRCDLTELFTMNKKILASAFAKQLVMNFLNVMAFTQRVGPEGDSTKKLAMAELDPKFSGSFITDYNQAIEVTNIDLSNFSGACLPCKEDRYAMRSSSI